MTDSEMYNVIRSLMGYTQNATDSVVTLYQDDATNTYHVKVNDKRYWGNSMSEVLEKAFKDNPKE